MSDYCKFNPDDPTCFGGDTYGFGLSSYATQTNKFTTNVPRRDFIPPPRRNFMPEETNVPLPPRRDFRPYIPPPRRDFRPMDTTHTPRSEKIRKRIQDENQFQTRTVPVKELTIFRKKYNQKLAQGKKRALEFVKGSRGGY